MVTIETSLDSTAQACLFHFPKPLNPLIKIMQELQSNVIPIQKPVEPEIDTELRPIAAILQDLKQPIPERLLKQKPVRNKSTQRTDYLTFCPWYNVVRLLDHFAPGFEYDCEPHFADGKTVVKATITIHGSDRSVSRSALGIEDSDLGGWGDPTSNASSMALRRAAAHFGLGLNLYWEK